MNNLLRDLAAVLRISNQILDNPSVSEEAREAAATCYNLAFKALRESGVGSEIIRSGTASLERLRIDGNDYFRAAE